MKIEGRCIVFFLTLSWIIRSLFIRKRSLRIARSVRPNNIQTVAVMIVSCLVFNGRCVEFWMLS